MANFTESVQYVLDNEGGYSNDPSDPGGATNFGITQDDLSSWRGVRVFASDVQHMSVDEAKAIYQSKYWVPLSCYDISSYAISTAIFDTGVLYGIRTSGRYAQQICADAGLFLKIDGIIGPKSVDAINDMPDKLFITKFHQMILDHIDALVEANNRLAKFKKGWKSRDDRLLTLV